MFSCYFASQHYSSSSSTFLFFFFLQVAQLSWLERKVAATLFGEPPTSSVEDALKNFLKVWWLGLVLIHLRSITMSILSLTSFSFFFKIPVELHLSSVSGVPCQPHSNSIKQLWQWKYCLQLHLHFGSSRREWISYSHMPNVYCIWLKRKRKSYLHLANVKLLVYDLSFLIEGVPVPTCCYDLEQILLHRLPWFIHERHNPINTEVSRL